MSSNPRKVPRLGVIPRYAMDESKMKWFEVPGFNIVHAINAWEEDDGDTIDDCAKCNIGRALLEKIGHDTFFS